MKSFDEKLVRCSRAFGLKLIINNLNYKEEIYKNPDKLVKVIKAK